MKPARAAGVPTFPSALTTIFIEHPSGERYESLRLNGASEGNRQTELLNGLELLLQEETSRFADGRYFLHGRGLQTRDKKQGLVASDKEVKDALPLCHC